MIAAHPSEPLAHVRRNRSKPSLAKSLFRNAKEIFS